MDKIGVYGSKQLNPMNIVPLNVHKPLLGTSVEVLGEFEEHRTISGRTEKLKYPKLYIREVLSPNRPLVSLVVYNATFRKVPTHNFTL